MKDKIHPPYQEVLFVDSSSGVKFICGSSVQPKQKETYQGKEYPVVYLSTSSSSHPFFTGSKQFIDTEGRVDKFTKKYAQKKEQVQKAIEKQEESKKEKETPKKKARVVKKKGAEKTEE
ncbi:MAG: type B 50S ribosomal protein L31 [Chlamydiae bacterium]|nr:type B 50S ribosomal protein L31 [Chlamydiota bacterium]